MQRPELHRLRPLRIDALAGLVVGLLTLGASGAAAQKSVPTEYHGAWVPTKATCESPVRVVITVDRLTLINGSDKQAIGGIEMAGPGYWGPDYTGIMAVLITEFDGQQPATASFNVGEKKGVAQVEFAPEMGGNPAQSAYNARIKQLNLAKRFPLNKVPLKQCAAESGAGGGAPASARQPSGKPATPTGPSACAGVAHCIEVKPFAATVADFRTSSAGTTKLVTINLRFQNRTSTPLILGYVEGSGIVTDDRGNRYAVTGQGAVRGIGEISNRTFDPKFTLQPGEASDARLEFQWTPQRGQIFGTTYAVELAIREIESLPANQYQLGKEHILKLDGFTAGTPVASAPPGGTPTTGAGPAVGAATAAPPAGDPDACAGIQRCYNAGPFAAEVTHVTMSKVTYYVVVKLNVKARNLTVQPLLLGWQNGSGSAIDDVGNRYAAKTVKGIGLVSANSADPQFALNPGQSRAFTVEYVFRANRSVVGTSWTAEFVLQQLEILPSRQVRSVREYSVSYQNLTAGNAGVGAASASDGATTTGSSDATAEAVSGVSKVVGKLFKTK
jgi:hypothetical protein